MVLSLILTHTGNLVLSSRAGSFVVYGALSFFDLLDFYGTLPSPGSLLNNGSLARCGSLPSLWFSLPSWL